MNDSGLSEEEVQELIPVKPLADAVKLEFTLQRVF